MTNRHRREAISNEGMTKMRLKKPFVAIATAGLLTLAACGGSGDGNGDTGASGGAGVDTENLGNTGDGKDATREGPVEIDGATEGGTVTVLTATGFTTPIDPADLYYTDTNAIMTGLVMRQLTQYVYDEASGNMVLVPDLATDLGTPNDDFTEWTFTLRDGVKWEDGSPVTAEQVKWGMERSFDGQTFVNGPGLYYTNPYLLGGEKWGGPYSDPKGKDEAISVDGNTITVKMAKPFPDFDYYVSFPAMGPVPEGKVSDPATYGQRPWSSGPYKIKKYVVGKSLVLERNDQWDPATDPGRTQYPDGYNFKGGQNPDSIDQLLLNDQGDAQTTLTYDDIDAKNYDQFTTQANDRLVIGGSPCTYFYALDNRTITDKKVREAVLWALPYKEQVLAAGLIPEVNAIPATNLMPPGIPGREEFNPVPDHEPFQTDAEKAKQLLEDSGNLGFELKFLFRTDLDTDVSGKDVLVKAFEAAGFKVKPVASTVNDYVADRDDPKGDINIRSYGWCSDWPSGATWIPPIFQSTDIEKVGFGTNEAAFNNPEIDDEINGVFELPADEQPAAWNALDEKVMTDYLPVIPRYYTGVIAAHGSKVVGFENDNTLGMPTFKQIWLQQ
jgi:peptide/nickel transport system substrate-binding protein